MKLKFIPTSWESKTSDNKKVFSIELSQIASSAFDYGKITLETADYEHFKAFLDNKGKIIYVSITVSAEEIP